MLRSPCPFTPQATECVGDTLKKQTLDPKLPTPVEESVAFSEFILPPDVEDIDANDGTNVLLASEYVTDIYAYLRHLEKKQSIRPNFLSDQRVLNAKMRSLLVDWLVNVHQQFKLLPETLYMGVTIMDRFFQYESVSKDKFQLIGVTSFFIASKYEEIIPPDLQDWVVICDQLYTKRDILKMEMVILRRLKFELGRPLPIHFLRRNSKAAHADPKIHTLAKYIMELSLMEATCSPWAPSLLAAASLYVTLKILSDGDDWGNWTPTLAHYSSYSEQQLQPFACFLCKLLQKAPHGRYTNVYKKYCQPKQLDIAKLPALECSFVQTMAGLADSNPLPSERSVN